MGRLQGKVAIITGAAKGLGEADARMFVREGARVILTDVDSANGERVAAELGDMAEYRHLDVRHDAEWRVLVDDVVARHGKLDILVNNAGVVELGDIETQTEKDYRFIMAVSADGTWFGCQHAVRVMKETGGGSIVNMASIASVQGESAVAAYCAAKGAVEGLTRAVAVHCARQGYNIRCNSIHPAGILTPMVIEVGRQAALMRGAEEALNGGPITKLGEPDDIAYTVVFLASDESKFINGAAIRVDDAKSVIAGNA
ncbi:short-chain dehydrogenase [Novosphingobium sediminis]|uniref:Short-chain dehydrogenase n=1 Tax=Novosphingobium sediminis TaxID=707214 RepID=A0A512ANJ4_9SPHN|nr:SDR family oxidoreductase [Novosphingobium sediminis]GEO01264.1 short-chain dehydrogenase [Novosphingobium sediminis]